MKSFTIVFKKELKDTLRDRRTLLIMLIVPFLLIPFLLSVFTGFASTQKTNARAKHLKVLIRSDGEGEELVKRLRMRKDLILVNSIPPYRINDFIRKDSIDLALIIKKGFDEAIAMGQTGRIEVRYNSTRDSEIAARLIRSVERLEEEILSERLDSMQATRATIDPVKINEVDVYSMKESLAKMGGGFLPYFFVLFALFGAMYPAIDLFTGEKERGTLETILSAPVSRLEIMLGKMAVIVLSGITSGALTILGLYVAVRVNTELPPFLSLIVTQLLTPKAIASVIIMMIPLTIFFAGLLIPASIYARSFKEAQSIIQPFSFVFIFPLLLGMVPGIHLNFFTALIPILNVALATKEIIAGTIQPGLFILVFLSLLGYAFLGVVLCIRRFSDEKNIFRE